jgi:hypothetical protein
MQEIAMNIDQAKAIPIADILSRRGIEARRTNHHRLLYLSPVRDEKTPSFWVDTKTNRWHDFGDGRGGDLIDLVCAYLHYTREAHTVADALRWIGNMSHTPHLLTPVHHEASTSDPSPALTLKTQKAIEHLGLIRYLEKRGIPLALARQHLREIHVRNERTQKSFFALGFANEEGGFELRNPFFKGSLGKKAISFVRGQQPKPTSIHLFEGFMDYLSAVCPLKGNGFRGDAIILNSLSCLRQITPYIHNYGYRVAYTWLDNDPAGEQVTASLREFFQTQQDLRHVPLNRVYAPHKDVNAWHMHKRGLTP